VLGSDGQIGTLRDASHAARGAPAAATMGRRSPLFAPRSFITGAQKAFAVAPSPDAVWLLRWRMCCFSVAQVLSSLMSMLLHEGRAAHFRQARMQLSSCALSLWQLTWQPASLGSSSIPGHRISTALVHAQLPGCASAMPAGASAIAHTVVHSHE
jgi:hypothetical protein